MAATIPIWLGNTNISGSVQDNNTVLKAIFEFMRSSNTVQQVWKLYDVGARDKSEMAAMNGKCIRHYVYLSFHAYVIATKVQWLYPCFRVRQHGWTSACARMRYIMQHR